MYVLKIVHKLNYKYIQNNKYVKCIYMYGCIIKYLADDFKFYYFLNRRHLMLCCEGSMNIFPFDQPLCTFSMESSKYTFHVLKHIIIIIYKLIKCVPNKSILIIIYNI